MSSKSFFLCCSSFEALRKRVCDFGFARKIDGPKNSYFTICGTDEWMSPEVMLGERWGDFEFFVAGFHSKDLLQIRRKSRRVQFWNGLGGNHHSREANRKIERLGPVRDQKNVVSGCVS